MRRIWPRRMALSMTELLGLKGAAGGERKRGERRNEDAGRITHERLAASRAGDRIGDVNRRSEEHTSELQSRPQLVCRLLLEKKNSGPVRGTVGTRKSDGACAGRRAAPLCRCGRRAGRNSGSVCAPMFFL